MSRFRVVQIGSIDALRGAAPAWDDLWWRSEVTLPTLRAELIAQWVEQFRPKAEFRALVVEDQGQWVAALPLVQRRLGHVIRAGTMPANEWSSRGELLLDASEDAGAVLDELVSAVRGLPWPLLWLDDVPLDTRRWQEFHRAAQRAEMPVGCRRRFCVGWIEIDHDWQACKSRWSRKHRQEMARSARRLAKCGQVQFRVHSDLSPEKVKRWLRPGFEVEDRSWKGQAGTSVLRTPGMFDFFHRQAKQLAGWEQLELCLLILDDEPIAFAYGMTAKGVFHSCKVGYDSRYALYSPGQLLRYYLLERFHGDQETRAIDCMGPIGDAHQRWRPMTYAVGRIVMAPRGRFGRMALHAYRHWWPQVRRLRGASEPDAEAGTLPSTKGHPLQPVGGPG